MIFWADNGKVEKLKEMLYNRVSIIDTLSEPFRYSFTVPYYFLLRKWPISNLFVVLRVISVKRAKTSSFERFPFSFLKIPN